MKKSIMTLTLTLTLTSAIFTQLAESAPKVDDFSYRVSETTTMYDLVTQTGKSTKFSAEEMEELEAVRLIPVQSNRKIFAVPTPLVSATDWTESTYGLNFKVTEKLAMLLLKIVDLKVDYIGALETKLRSGTLAVEDEMIAKATKDVSEDIQMEIVSIAQITSALTPLDPSLITNFKEALVFVNDAMRILPVSRASIKVGYGYSKERAEAYSKAKALFPEIQFNRLTPTDSTLIGSRDLPGSSLTKPTDKEGLLALAQQQAMQKLQTKLAEDLTGTRIGGAGATIGVDFFFNLANGWGMTANNPNAGAGSYLIPGQFETALPVSVAVNGTINCNFDARIKDGLIFRLETTEDGGWLDSVRNIPDAESRSTVTCEFKDENGVVLSNDGLIQAGNLPVDLPNREAAASSINVLLQSKIKEFTDAKSSQYIATTSLKQSILNQAVANKNGYKALPIPMTTVDIARWESLPPSCSKVPRVLKPKTCHWVVSTKYPSGKNKCDAEVVEFDEKCESVQRQVWETIEKPVRVVYLNEYPTLFEKQYNESVEYKISNIVTQNVVLAIGNDICISRSEISNPSPNKRADFKSCSARSAKDFKIEASDDLGGSTAEPSLPGVVIPD